MSATIQLFEKWKAAKGYASTREALKHLGLSSGAAVHWKNGKEAAADVIERMSRELGENPAYWAAKAMEGQTQGEAQRAWARIARQLGAAAVIVLAVALPFSDARAAGLNDLPVRHYAKWLCNVLRAIFRPRRHALPGYGSATVLA